MQLTMNDLFQDRKVRWLDGARQALIELLEDGQPYVTSDDLYKVYPLPAYLHKNTIGSVFDSRFKTVGFTTSKRKEARGRTIRQWALKRPVARIVEYENE